MFNLEAAETKQDGPLTLQEQAREPRDKLSSLRSDKKNSVFLAFHAIDHARGSCASHKSKKVREQSEVEKVLFFDIDHANPQRVAVGMLQSCRSPGF